MIDNFDFESEKRRTNYVSVPSDQNMPSVFSLFFVFLIVVLLQFLSIGFYCILFMWNIVFALSPWGIINIFYIIPCSYNMIILQLRIVNQAKET